MAVCRLWSGNGHCGAAVNTTFDPNAFNALAIKLCLLGIICGGKGVASDTTTNGKQDFDALALTCSDLVAQASTLISGRVAMTGEVEDRSLAIAELYHDICAKREVNQGKEQKREGKYDLKRHVLCSLKAWMWEIDARE
nr:hypothetical protein Iba_chr12bCG4150 [Ipomoea batatas]